MRRITAEVSHGFFTQNTWIRQFTLKNLNGYDEIYISKIKDYKQPFRTTALLARLTRPTESKKIDSTETMRHLTVGDRVSLTLQIRQLLFGDLLQCVLNCPSCRQPISLDLRASELLQQPIQEPKTEYPLTIQSEGKKIHLKIRPVTGADLESILESQGSPNFAESLIRQCVTSSDQLLPEKLDNNIITAISSELEKLDPQADIILKFRCPSCKVSIQVPFNVEGFVFKEILMRQKQVEKEIHWLAFNYHWSEDSILSLPVARRKRYVELINLTLSGDAL